MERKALIDRIQGVFMIRRYTVALMQMDTQNDKGKNLETACAWIDEAAAKGAKLICFPEVMNLVKAADARKFRGTRPSASARKRRNTASIFTGAVSRRHFRGKDDRQIRVC